MHIELVLYDLFNVSMNGSQFKKSARYGDTRVVYPPTPFRSFTGKGLLSHSRPYQSQFWYIINLLS